MNDFVKNFLRITVVVVIIYLPLSIITSYYQVTKLNQVAERKDIIESKALIQKFYKYIDTNQVLSLCVVAKSDIEDDFNLLAFAIKSDEATCEKNEAIFTQTQNQFLPKTYQTYSYNEKSVLVIYGEIYKNVEFKYAKLNPKYVGFFKLIFGDTENLISFILDLILVILTTQLFLFLSVAIFSEFLILQYRDTKDAPKWLLFMNKNFKFIQFSSSQKTQLASESVLSQIKTSNKKISLLENTIEHTVLQEIKKFGYKLPYQIDGAVTVVDVNGFSNIVAAGELQVAAQLKIKLKEDARELLQRYGGLYESMRGDDIVAIFRDYKNQDKNVNQSQNDFSLMALAFSRDLMQQFSKIKFFSNEKSYEFKLKTGLAFSKLNISAAGTGLDFDGVAMTLSARLSSAIQIKDRNIVCVLKNEYGKIINLVTIPAISKSVEFKGMGQQDIYEIDQFNSVKDCLENSPQHLNYFKSDEAIIFLLERLTVEADPQKTKIILNSLALIQVQVADSNLVEAWLKTLKHFTDFLVNSSAQTTKANEQLLTQILTLGKNLIPHQIWTSNCTEAVISAFNKNHARIGAQIVELLSEKDVAALTKMNLENFIVDNDPSFRTRGNILIFKALHMLTENVLSDIYEMLESENALRFSTGVYTACEVFNYYQDEGLQKLQTFDGYLKIKNKLSDINNKNSILNNNKNHLSDRLQNSLLQVLNIKN